MERARTTARIAPVRNAGLLRDTVSRANEAGSRRYEALIDVLALLDHSLEIRFGVNLGLICTTVRSLCSEELYTNQREDGAVKEVLRRGRVGLRARRKRRRRQQAGAATAVGRVGRVQRRGRQPRAGGRGRRPLRGRVA